MATSLQRQLAAAASPASALLQPERRRVSIIFSHDEAAKYDKDTFYQIGLDGLAELISTCPDLFIPFKNSILFSHASKNFERAMEDAETNKQLDDLIEKFLLAVSPFLMLKASLKCMEWLVYRFHIERFNIEPILQAILPFYDTKHFVMILQVLQFSGSARDNVTVDWQWLTPCIESATVLRKATLFGNANGPFILWLFQTLRKFLAVHRNHPDNLSTFFGFVVSTVLGIVTKFSREFSMQRQFPKAQNKKSIIQAVLNQIHDLFKDVTVGSEFEYVRLNKELYAMAYIIIATIGITTEENPEIGSTLGSKIKRIFNLLISNHEVVLLEETYTLIDMLLQHIYFEWTFKAPSKLERTLQDLAVVSKTWNVSNVAAKLILSNVKDHLNPFTVMKHLSDIQMDPEDRAELLAKCYHEYRENNLIKSSRKFLVRFEREYPTEFGAACESYPSLAEDFASLGSKDAALMVNHPDENIRAKAVRKLIKRLKQASLKKGVSKKKPIKITKTIIPDKNPIAEALGPRFSDESEQVVLTLIKTPLEKLLQIFTSGTLLEGCITVVKNKINNACLRLAVKKICDLANEMKLNESMEKRILTVLIPFLFPRKQTGLTIAEKIIRSEFATKNPILMKYADFPKSIKKADHVDVCIFSYKVLTSIEDKLKYNLSDSSNPIELIIALIMASNETDIIEVFDKVLKVGIRTTADFPISPENFAKCFTLANKRGVVSLELLLTSVLKVDINSFANQLQVIKSTWALSETEANRGTCMKFLKCFIQKIFKTSNQQFWFWLAALHPLSVKQSNNEDDLKMEFYLLRCLQFLSCFVQEFGIPAKVNSNDENSSKQGTADRQTSGPHKPLTRSQGEVDEQELTLSSPEKSRRGDKHSKTGKRINRSGVSPTWCLLEVLLSQCVQHSSHRIRRLCMNFFRIIKAVPKLSDDWFDLLEKLLAYEQEIIADHEQVGSIIGRIIVDADLTSVRAEIIKSLISPGLNHEVFMGLVNICQHTGSLMYNDLESLILKLLETDPESNQLLALLNCFEASPKSLEVLPRLLQIKGPSKVVLKKMSNRLFEKSNPEFRKQLFCLLIDAAVDCKLPEIKLAIQRCVRKWEIDATLISEEIKRCMGAERLISAAAVRQRNGQAQPQTENGTSGISDWKTRTEVILEFVQGMKKLKDTKMLLPPLFRILKLCISLEEQSPVEYLKQLTLTALTMCCADDEEEESKVNTGTFHVDLVIDCLRCSRNPQTHHHALILLNYAAKRFQEQVMHGVMSLFTFMGNSILRQDDTYSTQLIQQTVTTIIPALTTAGKGTGSLISRTVISAGIFRVFASALQDIPVHRRLPVFTSLVETLDPDECLWQVLIIIVDNALNRDRKKSNLSADLDLAVELAWSWGPNTVIMSLAKIYEFFISIPNIFEVSVTDEDFKKLKVDQSPVEKAVFDFSRKDNYRDIQVVMHYTVELIMKIASKFSENEIEQKLDFDVLVERCLSFSRVVSGLTEDKIFRLIAHKNFDVLEKINMVLEATDFVRVISVILGRKDVSIKRKLLDMFNSRLVQKIEWFGDLKILLPLLPSLIEVASLNPDTDDIVTLIQTSFLSMKLIAKHLASSHPDNFVSVFHLALEYSRHEKPLLCASSLLCIGELFCLKSLLLPKLNDVTSAILRAFKTSFKLHQFGSELILDETQDASQEANSANDSFRLEGQSSVTTGHLLCISTIACMNKMAEQLGSLMGSKFLKKALIIVLTIDAHLSYDVTSTRKKTFDQRIRALLKTIATKIPLRNSLIPLKGAFHNLLEKPKAAKAIMQILKESLQVTSKPDFVLILPALCEAFLEEFLGARYQISIKEEISVKDEEVEEVEDAAIDCLISGAVLKMSEGTFRPYYHKLFDWARENESRLITFYRFSAAAAERLKSLFVTFAGYVMNEAVTALEKSVELTKGVLALFYHLFSNDREGFITTDRFNTLVKPLVDLMESDYVLEGKIEFSSVSSTLIQLAAASNDLNRWQHMMDLISIEAHHSNKFVRLNVVKILEAAAAELGKDFLPLLPPVVPFLAELLNDDEAEVEATTQKMILKLEEIVGEPLQPYFT